MKRQILSVPRLAAVLVLLACLAVGNGTLRRVPPPAANAEEQGITVPLAYESGVSNWGPTNVYGTAQLWPIEGVATISVHFLPRLPNGEHYVWWVLNLASGSAMRLGVFNTTDAGDALQDVFLTTPFPPQADTVLVTRARPQDDLTSPGHQRTLAGHFAMPPAGTAPAAHAGQATAQPDTAISIKPKHPNTAIHYTHKLKLPVTVAVLPQTGGGPFLAGNKQWPEVGKGTQHGRQSLHLIKRDAHPVQCREQHFR